MSVKNFSPTLEIKFHRRRWRIMVGRSSLASFRSEQDAIDALNKRRSFYEYWAEHRAGDCPRNILSTNKARKPGFFTY